MSTSHESDPSPNIKTTITIDQESEDWKHRPPYATLDPQNGGFKPRYEGSCHCGRVKFQLSREIPLDAKFCHCTDCQRLHGAPFQWAAIFHKTDINFLHGHHGLKWYHSGEKTARHKLPCKVSCAYCGSPIMDEGRNMILMFPSMIHFGKKKLGPVLDEHLDTNVAVFEVADREKSNFAPTCHIFYGDRVVDIPDGKPKWKGLDGKSELMETEE
ncbi:unnamed protein product [Calypogeia fissa]